MEAEATGSGSNSLNASLMGHPISRATAPSITVHGCGGTRSCSSERLSMYGAGRRSGRDEANWAALIRVPPSAAAASSTRPAPRRCCSSQSSSSTRPGINRARARSAAYPTHKSIATTPSTNTLGEGAEAASSEKPGGKPGGAPPPAEAALSRRSTAERLAAVQRSAWARTRSPKRAREVTFGAPPAAPNVSRASSTERRAARASTSAATRASPPHTRAASARRRLAANAVGQAPSQLGDRFSAASAYNRLSASGSISSSLQRKQTNHRATAWPLILRRDRERNRRRL